MRAMVLERAGAPLAMRERPTPEDPAVQYGRDAELSLRQLVATHFDHKGAHLFAGRRVPCPRRGMRREIDLIVLTPRMISLIGRSLRT